MSTPLSYALAKTLLSEVEKERIVCTYLNATDPNAVDWEKAAAEYGAASVESYKKGMQNTAKKIKKAMDSGVQPDAIAAAVGTPVKSKGGRKRKEKSAPVAAESEAEEVVEEAPKKKKKAKGAKKSKAKKVAAAAAAAADDDEGEEGGVKAEGDDDDV